MSDAEEFNRAREVVVEYAQALGLPRTPSTDLAADVATVRRAFGYCTHGGESLSGHGYRLIETAALAALDRLEERARRAEEAEHAAREALQHSDNELHAIIAERTEYLSQRDAAYDVLRRVEHALHEAEAGDMVSGTVRGNQAWSNQRRLERAVEARHMARTFLDSITKGEPDA